jgi:hypothetical protein
MRLVVSIASVLVANDLLKFGTTCTSCVLANSLGSHPTQRRLHSAFVSPSLVYKRTALFQSRYDDFFVEGNRYYQEGEEELFQEQLAELFGIQEQFVPLSLAGRRTQSKNGVPIDILLLSNQYDATLIQDAYNEYLQCKDSSNECINALPIPLPPNTPLRLLSTAYAQQPLSKTKMLVLNSLLVNRDGGLFDNLPWASWTIDPDRKERDAANNAVDEKYSMGKRVAYQRFMGKDWKGQLSNRLEGLLDEKDVLSMTDEDMMASLSKRILEVEVADARADIAEYEQELSVKQSETFSDFDDEYSDFADVESDVQQMLEEARSRLKIAESSLEKLSDKSKGFGSIRSTLMSILTILNGEVKEAPYRGAIGYPPKKEDSNPSTKPYTSPYSLLMEIVNEQLNADIVACVLEQTSLFEGNLVLGGAIVLQRKGVNILELMGNDVIPQSLYVVECFADEAVGMAVETGLPICIESDEWTRAVGADVELDLADASNYRNRTVINRTPHLRPLNGCKVAVEGEKILSAQDTNLIRLPMSTTLSIFDKAIRMIQQAPDTSNASVFSTYSPVNSLDDYDSLTYDGKARVLLKMESFQGVLPRPRVVRSSKPSALDNLLLPLIDESVRRQYLIRDAEERNDLETANALRAEMSPRQSLLERAQAVREMGLEDEALLLENEADMLKSTRADFTQDEGAYNRFLDRDDWYERETQARIARYKKSRGID